MCERITEAVDDRANGNFHCDLAAYEAREEYESLLSKASLLHEEYHDNRKEIVEGDASDEEKSRLDKRCAAILDAIHAADDGDTRPLRDIPTFYYGEGEDDENPDDA